MKIKAAVVDADHRLSIETVELDPPQPGELLIRMQAAGVCHSDLHTYRGELSTEPPLVLGHEGAGVVEAVGAGVVELEPGDRVLINWLPACESCPNCLNGHFNLCHRLTQTNFAGVLMNGSSRLRTTAGQSLKHYLGAASMAEYAVIDAAEAVRLPPDVPFAVGAIIGCAVATGVGAVINTAQAKPGRAAAVIGCGGVGLSIIQGCRLAGCHPIVAVDITADKLAFARQLGATEVINAAETDPVEALRGLPEGGPAYVFDSVGSTRTIPQALRGAGPGGTAVIVGLHSAQANVPLTPADLIYENKRLLGCFAGSGHLRVDLPRLIELYRAGRLELDALITRRYPLTELEAAFSAMEKGALGRSVITFEDTAI